MRRYFVIAIGSALVALGASSVPPTAASSGCVRVTPPVGPAYVDCALGQALNVLPPGSDGLTNATEFAQEQAGGPPPPHQQDQVGMYSGLLQVAPNVQAADLGKYYKVSQLGYNPNDVDHIDTPHQGTVVVWDRSFGVPHVFGATRFDTEFGAGWAAARDRLFMMDALRHLGRSRLSEFAGPSPSNLAMDCSIARVAGYSETELQQQYAALPVEFPQKFVSSTLSIGAQLQHDGQAYIAGVNAYISAATSNPDLMPVEYAALQKTPQSFKVTDIIAIATLVQSIFAVGGGNEVQSALLYSSLTSRYGQQQGAGIWGDLRAQNDPEAPTTLSQAFPYMQVGQVDPASVAMPIQAPTSNFCTGTPVADATPSLRTGPPHVTIDLAALLRPGAHSNALVVAAANSGTGHPIAVFGPQVSYFAPEILHEVDLHGPGIEARGVAFSGTDLFVELGRGVDYAWSATSAGSDIADEVAERLCNPDGSPATMASTAYLYNGTCTPMYERRFSYVAQPNPGSPNPPERVSIHIERTIHGPVVGRTQAVDPATGQHVPVAISYQRSTFSDELSAAPAFMLWNDPDYMHGAQSFLKAAGVETGTFNWFYVDSHDAAYYSSGRMPRRNPAVNPNFPRWGTGQWDWQGFLPGDGSATDPHPHAINPPSGWMTNWNNKPAPGWSAADSQFGYGPVYRVQSLSDRLSAILAKGPAQPVDVVNAMEDAGSVDLDGSQLVTQLTAALQGASLTPAQAQVLSILQNWASAGAHRRALADPSQYDQGNAVTIMDALYPRLTQAVFSPWLDPSQLALLQGILPDHNPPGPVGSAYDSGWEGYLQRALRQAVNPAIPNPYSQSYCGAGSLAACQTALVSAIQGAVDALTAAYSSSDPNAWTCSRANTGSGQCTPAADDIVFSAVGVEKVPNLPWVNRPTFQQVVSYPAQRS